MNNVKKIGLLLLISGLMTGFAQAAEKPDATVRLTSKAVAAGVGFGWGKGMLTYKAKRCDGAPVQMCASSTSNV